VLSPVGSTRQLYQVTAALHVILYHCQTGHLCCFPFQPPLLPHTQQVLMSPKRPSISPKCPSMSLKCPGMWCKFCLPTIPLVQYLCNFLKFLLLATVQVGQPARPHSHHQGHPGVQPCQGQLAGAEPTGRHADVWPSRPAPVRHSGHGHHHHE